MLMRTALLPALALLAAFPASAQTWYGRDIAASAEPIRTVGPENRDARTERGRDVRVLRDGWRPQRNLYVDPYGRVTVWAGEPPFWSAGPMRGYDPSTPDERAYYGERPQRPVQDPCAAGLGGAASASAAINSAASASGRRC